MKRNATILAFFLCFIFSASAQSPKREFRGAWIATVTNLDWPPSGIIDPATQKSRFIQMLDGLQSIGINAVVFQVRTECDALYQSPYEPWSYYLTGSQGTAPSPFYDPLQFAVEEVHKRGMELHAWFNPYRAVRSVGSYTVATNHVSVQHPEWIVAVRSLKLLNPGEPGVREYVAKVVTDIVRRYDVDGIHADDYFYPYPPDNVGGVNLPSTFDDSTYEKNPRGISDRADWRRDNINILLHAIYDSVQAIKPWVKFGMSPFGIWKNGVPSGISGMDAYSVIYCDAVSWLQGNYVDYIAPQLYWQIGGPQDYLKLLPWWASQRNSRHFYPGQAPYRIPTWSAYELPNQIRANRTTSGVGGSVFFRTNNGLLDNLQGFTDSLRRDLFQYKAIPPMMAWKDSVIPNPPSNLRYEPIASGGPAVLRWNVPSPGNDGDTASRYVIYRFVTSTPQQSDFDNPASILSLGGNRDLAPPVPPTGGPWYYAVSSLDRNNNESVAGNVLSVAPPSSPVLAMPADSAIGRPPSIDFTWNASPLAAYYHLQVSSDSAFASNFILNASDLVDTVKTATGFTGQQRYFWRVSAATAGGNGLFSPTWSFTTGFPATPQLTTPANFSDNVSVNPTLAWNSTQAAEEYRLQVSATFDFAGIVLDTTAIQDTSMALTGLQGDKIHFWRVSATNSIGSSLWSDVWRFRTEIPVTVSAENEILRKFEMSQNYPNPFNPATSIRVAVPQAGYVTLRVYDILGREVATLVDNELTAGIHTFRFDGSRLSSGTYFYVLMASETRIVKKMMLLK